MSDAQLYRSKEEVEEYKKIDPITQVLDVIKDQKYATEAEIEIIDQRNQPLVRLAPGGTEQGSVAGKRLAGRRIGIFQLRPQYCAHFIDRREVIDRGRLGTVLPGTATPIDPAAPTAISVSSTINAMVGATLSVN